MSSRRTAKVNRAILETVSTTVLQGLKDPRVRNVTVTKVEAAEDNRSAKVYVSVMGDVKVQALTMRGLNAARGFLQSKVGDRLQTKHTPILQFVLDPGVKISAAVSAALRAALPPLEDAPLTADDEEDVAEEMSEPASADAVAESQATDTPIVADVSEREASADSLTGLNEFSAATAPQPEGEEKKDA